MDTELHKEDAMCHAFLLNEFFLQRSQLVVRPLTKKDNYETVQKLYTELFPDREGAVSYDRFRQLLKNKDFVLIGAFLGDTLVGIASLIRFQSLYRTAVLIEEFVVDEGARGKGIGKAMCDFIIAYVREHTDATRIESTARSEAMIAVYERAGFIDRKNRSMLYLVGR